MWDEAAVRLVVISPPKLINSIFDSANKSHLCFATQFDKDVRVYRSRGVTGTRRYWHVHKSQSQS